MPEFTDHYSVLGLAPSAEPTVIKAAYRVLIATYHPDKNKDLDAHEKTKQINLAYETLSDPIKRSLYDEEYQSKGHGARSSEFDREQPFCINQIEQRWSIATSFYPDIDIYYKSLGKISWRLAFMFKLKLLEEQRYNDAKEIAKKLKAQYLSRFFGKNESVVDYAEEIIKAKEIQAAIYLSQVINVMGSSVDLLHIKQKISDKFLRLDMKLNCRRLYSRIKTDYGTYNTDAAIELVRISGGLADRRLLSDKITISIDGKTLSFKDSIEFCHHILHRYAEKYA